MPSLREFIPVRYREVEAELEPALARAHALKAELEELRRVASDMGLELSPAGDVEHVFPVALGGEDAGRRVASEATIKETVVSILREAGHGMTATDILPRINMRLNVDYPRSSLSPQLSRLKSDGRLVLEGSVWSLAQNGAPSSNEAPPVVDSAANAGASRRMAPQWSGMLNFMAARYPTVLTNDDLVRWGQENGHGFSRHSLRATLYGWRERSYIEAIADGQHRVTAKGAAVVGRAIESQEKGPADEAGPSLELGGG